MRSRSDDIRRRIEKRKRERERMTKQLERTLPWAEDEERYGFEKMTSYESGRSKKKTILFFVRKFGFLSVSICHPCASYCHHVS